MSPPTPEARGARCLSSYLAAGVPLPWRALRALVAAGVSFHDAIAMSEVELLSIPGVGPDTARRLQEHVATDRER